MEKLLSIKKKKMKASNLLKGDKLPKAGCWGLLQLSSACAVNFS